MIYLASPYSHEDKKVEQQRFDAACEAAACFVNKGIKVFSPIAHSHQLTSHGARGDWEYWKEFDLGMINVCDSMYVLTLDGWRDSVGVQAEIDYALSHGLTVRLVREGMVI